MCPRATSRTSFYQRQARRLQRNCGLKPKCANNKHQRSFSRWRISRSRTGVSREQRAQIADWLRGVVPLSPKTGQSLDSEAHDVGDSGPAPSSGRAKMEKSASAAVGGAGLGDLQNQSANASMQRFLQLERELDEQQTPAERTAEPRSRARKADPQSADLDNWWAGVE